MFRAIPAFVIENMPGAGSLIAANHLYNKAAQDGTTLGMVSRNIPNYALMRQPNANYDPLKFNWIGSPEITHRGCYARADAGIKSPEDLFVRELVVGGDGAGTALTETPLLLKNLLGMKFKVIDGYKGATGVILAMERGELEGICQTTSAFLGSAQHLLDDGTFRILFTTEREPVPELKVPTVFAYAKTDEQRQILAIHASSLELGRPILAPPNVPADRVAALRRAFDAAMQDPALLAEARQMKLQVEARSGRRHRGRDPHGRGAAAGAGRQGGAHDADSTIAYRQGRVLWKSRARPPSPPGRARMTASARNAPRYWPRAAATCW